MKIDKAAYDYYNRLTSLFTLMRSVGVNYNQVTKAVHTNFNERRAVALLARLEKYTGELQTLDRSVIELTRQFEQK